MTTFDGLLVDFARAQGAKAVLRGIRAITDYEYEFPMAMMNRKLDPNLETLFMMPTEQYTYVSSRLIKGVFKLGGDVTELVPPLVMRRMKKKGQRKISLLRSMAGVPPLPLYDLGGKSFGMCGLAGGGYRQGTHSIGVTHKIAGIKELAVSGGYTPASSLYRSAPLPFFSIISSIADEA